jgi:hypothetical protein
VRTLSYQGDFAFNWNTDEKWVLAEDKDEEGPKSGKPHGLLGKDGDGDDHEYVVFSNGKNSISRIGAFNPFQPKQVGCSTILISTIHFGLVSDLFLI